MKAVKQRFSVCDEGLQQAMDRALQVRFDRSFMVVSDRPWRSLSIYLVEQF